MSSVPSRVVAKIARDSADVIRRQKDTIDKQAAEIEQYRRADRVNKIANDMLERGLITSDSFEATTERLKEAANNGKLDVVEEAVNLRGEDLWGKIASTADAPGNAGNPLFSYLLRERT